MDDGNTFTWSFGRCLRRLCLQRRTETFLLHRSFLPPMDAPPASFFSHFFFFLFFVRLDRPQWRWLTDAPCRCLLTCFALLPFSFPFRKSVDFRQLSCPSAPPAAMMTTAMITGFFVLSSGFGLSSGWHVHPPTYVTWQIHPLKETSHKTCITVRVNVVHNIYYLLFNIYIRIMLANIHKIYISCQLKILHRIVFDLMFLI